jgi:hypothetical protein
MPSDREEDLDAPATGDLAAIDLTKESDNESGGSSDVYEPLAPEDADSSSSDEDEAEVEAEIASDAAADLLPSKSWPPVRGRKTMNLYVGKLPGIAVNDEVRQGLPALYLVLITILQMHQGKRKAPAAVPNAR